VVDFSNYETTVHNLYKLPYDDKFGDNVTKDIYGFG